MKKTIYKKYTQQGVGGLMVIVAIVVALGVASGVYFATHQTPPTNSSAVTRQNYTPTQQPTIPPQAKSQNHPTPAVPAINDDSGLTKTENDLDSTDVNAADADTAQLSSDSASF